MLFDFGILCIALNFGIMVEWLESILKWDLMWGKELKDLCGNMVGNYTHLYARFLNLGFLLWRLSKIISFVLYYLVFHDRYFCFSFSFGKFVWPLVGSICLYHLFLFHIWLCRKRVFFGFYTFKLFWDVYFGTHAWHEQNGSLFYILKFVFKMDTHTCNCCIELVYSLLWYFAC